MPTVTRHVALCAILLPAALHSQLLLNTFPLSGSGDDEPTAIATDPQGNVYLAGTTTSPDFPLSHALIAQFPEPALELAADGRTFAPSTLSATQVTALAASSNGQVVLASTDSGLYRSPDAGVTWTRLGAFGPALALAIDPTNPNAVYGVSQTSGGTSNWYIWKSNDGGITWNQLATYALGVVTVVNSRVAIDPQNPSNVYAFIAGTLYRSHDAGATWNIVQIPAASAPGGLTSPTGFALAPSQSMTAYATTFYTPLMKTVDGGATWQPMAQTGGSAGPSGIAVDPHDPATVWIVAGRGIEKSTDGGATVQVVASPGNGSWQSIAVSPADPTHVYAADRNNVYATFDGGATWATVASGQIDGVLPTPTRVFVAASVTPTVFLAKLDPSLSQIVYSTLLGPGSVSRIALDAAGNVFLAGATQSHGFPTTAGALGRSFQSATAGFVAKLRADGGALLYSTLLDGLTPNGIAVDPAGNAIIAGAAAGPVPVTPGVFQRTVPGPCTRTLSNFLPGATVQISTHAFAAKLNPDASAYLYATYLTGSCGDAANDVALDSTGAIWIGGLTYSLDFPVTPGALTGSFPTTYNAGFVSQLSPAGDRLLYSTFVGGASEGTVNALALDPQGNVIAAGETTVQPTPGAYQGAIGGCPPIIGFFGTYAPNDHGFVLKFNPSSPAPLFAANIGGACLDYISYMSLDSTGNIWTAGRTDSTNFPTVAPLPNLGAPGGNPGFLTALDPSGANLISSSIASNLGFVASGPAGQVYFAERVEQPGKNGYAVLVARIDANQRPAIALDAIHSFGSGQFLAPAYIPFVIAPGQAVRLIGRGIGPANQVDAASAPAHVLATLAGVEVTFNGIPAELVSVQASEIVCFAPFALDGATSATVQVTYNGQISNPYSIPVVPQNVDIVAVANQDGSANSESNPAVPASVALIYITGVGQTNPPSVDGAINTTPLISPRTFPQISVNGSLEKPAFVGAAVGQVAGVMQLNLFVPDPGASNNDAVYIGNTFLRIYARSQ